MIDEKRMVYIEVYPLTIYGTKTNPNNGTIPKC